MMSFAVFIVSQVAADGKSTWFDGVRLLAVSAIIWYFILLYSLSQISVWSVHDYGGGQP